MNPPRIAPFARIVAALSLVSCAVLAQAWPPFDEAFAELERLELSEHLSVAVVQELRQTQERLRDAIEPFTGDTRDELIQRFSEFLGRFDEAVGQKPLMVSMSTARRLLVRNHTELFMRIITHYKLMDQSGGRIDLARFAGIADEDLAGLDTFAAYTAARSIGPAPQIPLFELYSPLGNLQLLDRLARKFADEGISQQVGPQAEIVYDALLSCIDGTKPVYDEAVAVANRVFADCPVPLPGSPLTIDTVLGALGALEALNRALSTELGVVLDSFAGEAEFAHRLRQNVAAYVRRGSTGRNGYSELTAAFYRLLVSSAVSLDLGNGTVVVSGSEVTRFLYGIPSSYSRLLEFPGAASDINREFVLGFIGGAYYGYLQSVRPGEPWPEDLARSVDELPVPPEDIAFSLPARRLQLLQVFLDTWGNELLDENGALDFDALSSRLVIDGAAEEALAGLELVLAGQIETLRNMPVNGSITEGDYGAAKDLLTEAKEACHGVLDDLTKDVIAEVRTQLRQRVEDRFNAVVLTFEEVLGESRVRVETASGQGVVFEPRNLESRTLGVLLSSTAIPDDYARTGYALGAYGRLPGVEPSLDGLLTSEQFRYLTMFGYRPPYPMASMWVSAHIEQRERWFRLMPRIVARFGTTDPDRLVRQLTVGVPLPVLVGENLYDTIRGVTTQHCAEVVIQLGNRQPRTVGDLLAMRRVVQDLCNALRRALRPFVANVSDGERRTVETRLNNRYDVWATETTLGQVVRSFEDRIRNAATLYVGDVRVPAQTVLQVSGFPYSREYDEQRFPGLLPTDFDGAENADEAREYRWFQFAESFYQVGPGLSDLGRLQALECAVQRLADSPVTQTWPPSELDGVFYYEAGVRTVDPEAFRRVIQGVPALIERLRTNAAGRCADAKATLVGAVSDTMTIDTILGLYRGHVLACRQDLLDLLQDATSRHEVRDVMQAENSVATVYRTEVFDTFTGIVANTQLVTEDGVPIPVDDIIAVLTDFVGGIEEAENGAYELARLPGIDFYLILSLHKLEEYLNEQVVALPRTSESVKIVSQLSSLGYMQLAAHLTGRYREELVDAVGNVDLTGLLALLTDRETAIADAKLRMDAIRDEALAELAQVTGPVHLDTLDEIADICGRAKEQLVLTAIRFLSGLAYDDIEELRVDFEAYVNTLYAEVKSDRDRVLAENAFEFDAMTADGVRTATADLAGETVERFIAFAERYADAYNEGGDTISLYPSPMAVADPAGIAREDVWWSRPVPWPDYDQHPTVFGMQVLLARLAAALADFVVAEGDYGVLRLDMGLFLAELEKPESDRAERRLAALLDRELPALAETIELRRDQDGAFPVGELGPVTDLFLNVKETIRREAAHAYGRAREVWAELVALYESNMFDGTLSFLSGDARITFDARLLDEVLIGLAHEGQLDHDFLALFFGMLTEGETTWEYSAFAELWGWYSWDMALDSGPLPGAMDAASDTSAPAPSAPSAESTSSAGSFTLGDLSQVPAIQGSHLTGLDVSEHDYLSVVLIDPARLLGELNMRALAPGSGAKASVAGASYDLMADEAAVAVNAAEALAYESLLEQKSYRFRVFELIPAMLVEAGDLVVDDQGRVTAEAFADAIRRTAPLGEDLFPIGDRAGVRPVDCTADPQNPVLLQVARHAALQVLGPVSGFRHVQAFPWHSRVPGVSRLFGVDAEFDLLVTATFTALPEDPAGVAEKVADALKSEWYVSEAWAVPVLDTWRELAAVRDLHAFHTVAVAIRIAPVDMVRRYWRVNVPVVRDTVYAIQEGRGGETGDFPGQFLLDPTTGTFAPGPGEPQPPEPEELPPPTDGTLVEVTFSELSPITLVDTATFANRTSDYVWLSPNSQNMAVGYLAVLGGDSTVDPATPGRVAEDASDVAGGAGAEFEIVIDPRDMLPEPNEDNNTVIVHGQTPNFLPGVFRAVAVVNRGFSINDGTILPEGELVVIGQLLNPTERALQLEFPSSLQMDFRIGTVYRWSAGRAFLDVVTRITVPPGGQRKWRLAAPLSEITVPIEDVSAVDAFLSGTDYEDSAPVMSLHSPQVVPDADELLAMLDDVDDGTERPPNVFQEIIVGGNDAIIPIEVGQNSGGAPVNVEVTVSPSGGFMATADANLRFVNATGAFGEDIAMFATAAGDGTSSPTMVRLKIGPQMHKLSLKQGWNLVSFPVAPFEEARALLDRVAMFPAWTWRQGRYEPADEIQVGRGMWLFCLEDAELEFLGEPRADVKADLSAGWNLMGTVNDDQLPSHPSLRTMFEWTATGRQYRSPSRLRSGKAYWLFADEPLSLDIR